MWNLIHCAVQGRGHIKEKIPCQDKTHVLHENDTSICALADGAGSASLSHIGAEAVVQTICQILVEKFDSYFNENDAERVRQALHRQVIDQLSQEASLHNCQLQDLASTLLFVAVKDDRYLIGQLGDGIIAYMRDGMIRLASQPLKEEFVNVTLFTTSPKAASYLQLIKGHLGNIQGFALFSDGAEAGLYNKSTQQFARGLRRTMQLARIESAQSIQEQLEYGFEHAVREATMDDCSIALMIKKSRGISNYLSLTSAQKREIVGLSEKSPELVIKRYDELLSYLQERRTLSEIAKYLHVKRKYVKTKYLDRLKEIHLIEIENGYYKSIF